MWLGAETGGRAAVDEVEAVAALVDLPDFAVMVVAVKRQIHAVSHEDPEEVLTVDQAGRRFGVPGLPVEGVVEEHDLAEVAESGR